MALLERLAILITADAAGAVEEMKKVAAETDKNLGKAGDSAKTWQGTLTKASAAMMGVGAGLLAVGISAASSTTDLGREVIKLQRYTGMTAEEASRLRAAAQLSGVQVDSLAIGLGRLSKAAESNSPAFDRLGINIHNADGSVRSIGSLLPDVAERFKQMGPGTERTALALQLFGRNGMDLMPFLQRGRDGIAELSNEAQKMGLVLSEDNISAIKDHIKAQRELTATFDGLKTKIGLQMMPVLTGFTDVVKSVPGPLLDIIGPLTVFGGLGLTAAGGIGMLVGQLSNFGKFASSAISGAQNLLTQVSAMPLTFALAAGGIAVLGLAIYAYQQKLADAAAAGRKALGDLSNFSTDELKQKLADVSKQVEKLKAVSNTSGSESLWRWITGKDEDYARAKEQKKAIEEAIAAANSSSGPMMSLAEAQQSAADATENHTSAVETLHKTLNASLDPFTKAIDAANSMADAQRKLTEAGGKVSESQNAYNNAVRQFGIDSPEARKALDDLTQAQRDLDSAQGNAFKTALAYEQSISSLGASMKDHPEIYRQNIEKINAMERSGAINAETAARMRDRLREVAVAAGAIPGAAGTVVFADTDDARRRLAEIRDLIRDIIGLDNSLNGDYGRGLGIVPRRAVGGPITPGQPYLVGELGPELIVPSSAGTVMTAQQTQQALGGGQSVGDVNVYVNSTNANPYDIGRELVWALRVAR